MDQEGYGELERGLEGRDDPRTGASRPDHVHELLDAEVSELAGERYVRKSETVRAGTIVTGLNPGTVKLAGQRVPIRVPRVRGRRRRDPVELVRESESPR